MRGCEMRTKVSIRRNVKNVVSYKCRSNKYRLLLKKLNYKRGLKASETRLSK